MKLNFEKKRLINNLKNRTFRIFNQVKKEFRILWTDKFNLFIALIVPPLIVALLGMLGNISTNVEINPINCVVVSYDSNTFINENNFTESKLDKYHLPYLNSVNKSEYLQLLAFYNATEDLYGMETARELLKAKEIEIIIAIPVDFTELIEWGYPGLVDCIIDSSDATKIQNRINAVFDSVKIFTSENNLTPQFKLNGFEEFAIPEEYNATFNNSIVMALSFMVIGVGMVLTILVIVQEKPIARLLLTPIQRSEILTAKYLSYITLLVIQNLSLVITAISFNLYIAGSVFDLFLAIFMLGFSGLSLGIFISSNSKTKTEANQLFFAVFLVLVLLSGTFIPIDAMPIFLQIVAYILPLSHGDPLIRGIITKGKSVFGFDFYILLIVSIVLVVFSFILFKRRKYEV